MQIRKPARCYTKRIIGNWCRRSFCRLLLCTGPLLSQLFPLNVSAQANTPEQINSSPPAQTYPRITGYISINHPLVTFSSDGTNTNFDGSYTVGVPTGINLWKSSKIGFSMEITPFIKAENGTSSMNNLLFHPGILLALGDGYTFIGRAAFETAGRYGLTPIINKVIVKNKNSSYFLAVPLPLRFGNEKSPSFTIAFQFGIAF